MATLEAEGRDLGSYCPGNWCRWNAQTEKKESAWFWPLNWKSEWQTLTLWLHSLIKVSLFLPYYGHLKGFCWKHCSLGATKSRDAFDVHTTVYKRAAIFDLLGNTPPRLCFARLIFRYVDSWHLKMGFKVNLHEDWAFYSRHLLVIFTLFYW